MAGLLELFETLSSKLTRKDNFPGKSVVSQAEGVGGHTDDIEVYGLPGVVSVPPEGARLIFVPVGGSRKNGAAIAGHNYAVDTAATQGDTVVFATGEDGSAIVCKLWLKSTGELVIETDAAVSVTSASGVSIEAQDALDLTAGGDATISATGNAVIDATEIRLNGSTKSFVTHAELDSALQTFVTSLKAELAAKLPPGPSSLTLDISAAEASTIKTG